MTQLSEYKDKYPEFRLERENGILRLTFHTDGGEWLWSAEAHRLLADLLLDIDADRENRVLVLASEGENFLSRIAVESFQGITWDVITWEAKRYINALMNLEIPVIAAVRGRCTIHAEIALLSDVILATPDAVFGDATHVPRDVVPGDGTQIIWSTILGPNRARYMLFAEKLLTAQQALDFGLIGEIVADEDLLKRAGALAGRIAEMPSVMARNTRTALLRPIRRAFEQDLVTGLALQGAAYGNRPHRGTTPSEAEAQTTPTQRC